MKTNLLLVTGCMIICSFAFTQTALQKNSGNNFSDLENVKQLIPLKKNSVKIYPNPSYGKITISTNSEAQLDFYIFDLEGILIYQTTLKNKETKAINALKKGIYTYDVFEKDESVEEGRIVIK